MQPTDACALHPEKARRFYCTACAQVLCETCAAAATHTDHQIYPLIAAAKLHKVCTSLHQSFITDTPLQYCKLTTAH